VYLSKDELAALTKHLGITRREFRRRYAFRDEDGWTQLKTAENRCVFLDPKTNACTVYPVRPTQCRTFPFWSGFVVDGEWTDEVRGLCEGIGRGRLYSIEEAEVRMAEMRESEDE
jgi:Fe-S-cluster containining protein